jgi:hypothetical protein
MSTDQKPWQDAVQEYMEGTRSKYPDPNDIANTGAVTLTGPATRYEAGAGLCTQVPALLTIPYCSTLRDLAEEERSMNLVAWFEWQIEALERELARVKLAATPAPVAATAPALPARALAFGAGMRTGLRTEVGGE